MKDPRNAILTTEAMYAADRYAIEQGRTGAQLMDAAGAGVAKAITRRWSPRKTAVLCGPGNNGGDGWEVAQRLRAQGWPVTVFSMVDPSDLKGDAVRAAAKWRSEFFALEAFSWSDFDLVVDALFGAGLTRPLEGEAARIASGTSKLGPRNVVSVDVPSGIAGSTGRGAGFFAALTVTFHRYKPAHLLEGSAFHCGEVELVDIGIPDGWETAVEATAALNTPTEWFVPDLERPLGINKHSRGRVVVRTGPAGATGAARLAGLSALVAGAGFVTLLCPDEGALSEVVTAERSLVAKLDPDYERAKLRSVYGVAVLGPGAGKSAAFKTEVIDTSKRGNKAVFDADALSGFHMETERFFEVLSKNAVLTPHDGEFGKLFPSLGAESKIELVRDAARISGAVVLLKGPDTVIATPDGRVRVNIHASPRLATAGTGDVLAGLIAALMARGMSAFDAASAGAWIQGEAGRRCGAGSSVEDVLKKLPAAYRHVLELQRRSAAQQRVSVAGG